MINPQDSAAYIRARIVARSPALPARQVFVLSEAPIARVVQPPEGCRESFAVRGEFTSR